MFKRSIIASAGMHLGIIIAATVAWPHAVMSVDDSPPVVPVDLVTVADVTNISATVEKQDPTPPPEQPPPKVEETPPPPPPPPQAEVAPTLPDQKPPPPPKKVEAEAKPPAKPAIPRPKPQKEPPPPKFDINNVLASLDQNQRPKAPPTPANAKVAETIQKGFGDQTAMTIDIKDALLAQMRECWNVPVGAPNPEQLIVQVRVFLAPDGSLAQAPVLEPATKAAEASNPYIRTAAEAALRAINVCEPYKNLPPERYATWREIVMIFDPSKMVTR
jgi:outer membrane biosynthesis protein TonB